MEQKLRKFLNRYLGQGIEKKDIVTQEAIDLLIIIAVAENLEEKIIYYGTNHPDAPFWDFLNFIPRGLPPDDDGADLLEDDE